MLKYAIPLILIISSGIQAQPEAVRLEFEQLPEILAEQSPGMRLLEAGSASFEARRSAGLQWSNPDLNFARENLSGSGQTAGEQTVTFSKSFRFPTSYLKERQIWKARGEAQSLDRQQQEREYLAQVRALYVRTRLLKEFDNYSSQIGRLLAGLAETVQNQHSEGTISQIEAQLLAAGLFELRSEAAAAAGDYRLTASDLKVLLGYDHSQELDLATSIGFQELKVGQTDLLSGIDSQPNLAGRASGLAAKEQEARLAGRDLIPELSLEGGYKEDDNGLSGLTMGISIPLPLLNTNRAAARLARAELDQARTENSLFRSRLLAQAANLAETVNALGAVLEQHDNGANGIPAAENLLAAYREGALSLPDLLNSLQVHRQSSRQYSSQLAEYYLSIFELEALTGLRLIEF